MENGSHLPGPPSPEEKERRANLFRMLAKPKMSRNQWIGVVVGVVVALAVIGGGSAGGVVAGLLILGALGWLVIGRQRGELPAPPAGEVLQHMGKVREDCGERALERLKLDPEEDVIQAVVLFGGAPRDTIEGRIRTLRGTKPYPVEQWFPGTPDPQIQKWVFGRYQIHVLFAMEDSIAYYTRHYDYIDGDYVEFREEANAQLVEESTNKIYYRNIENVRMTSRQLELFMVSGRVHGFGLRVPREEDQNGAKKAQAGGKLAHEESKDLKMIDEKIMDAGRAFEHAVNQLRDEWERRQRVG